jgi:hypothetical protein
MAGRLRGGWAFAFPLFFVAGTASADPVSRRFLPDRDGVVQSTVPVTVVGENGESFVVGVHPEDPGVSAMPFYVAQCRTPCTVEVPRGHYRIFVAETPGTFGGGRRELVDAPMRLTMIPRVREQRPIGLALGILGPVALFVGTGLLLAGLDQAVEESCAGCSHHDSNEALFGAALLLSGAAITPIGWVLFGKSFHPAIEVERRAEPSFAPRFGILPLRGGVGFGASVSL